jgi:putative membrane protein
MLYVKQGVGDVLVLLSGAGWGLVVAALLHIVPMALNARAWQLLFTVVPKPGFGVVCGAVWIRESVNGLLPVARIGGEIASYRLLTGRGIGGVSVAASLIVDMTICVVTQALVSALGVALMLATDAGASLVREIAGGLLLLSVVGLAFLWAQRGRALGGVARRLDRLVAGRFRGALAYSNRLDRALRVVYQRSRAVLACALWQALAWIAGALEIWAALYFLGHPSDALTALVLELAIQAVSSVAFVVPGALGVQEGAFVIVGRALGLDVSTALALAAARRLRDAVIFFPGLMLWQWTELSGRVPHRSA